MQFIDNAPLYKLVRITGPTHNLLGLQIARVQVTAPTVEALDQNATGRIKASDVLKQVMLGVEDAARALHRTFEIEKILYVSSDTPSLNVYRYLALEILRRVARTTTAGNVPM